MFCLIKRVENCVKAKINHIHFHGDYLVFEFAKSKGHKKGDQHLGPWHFYANPSKMCLCPVLSLLRYLFCYPDLLNDDVPLSEEKSYYRLYSTKLIKPSDI